jgi:hypothetical protein
MWIMLMHSTAWASIAGHGCAVTSSAIAGRTLDSPLAAIQASMLARDAASGSLG